MNDKNRIFYFMGGTLAVGLLVALIFFISGKKGIPEVEPTVIILPKSNAAGLQEKINELNNENVTPAYYNTLRTEITSSLEQKIIVKAEKEYLLTNLEQHYTNLTLKKIKKLFAADPVNEAAMQPLIGHLQSLGKGQQEINTIKKGIAEISYYNQILPAEVSKFTASSFVNFNDGKYKALKAELENLPDRHSALQNRQSVKATKAESLAKLTKYYQNYVAYNMAMQNVGINNDGN